MNLRVYTLNSRNGLKPDIKNELLRGVFRVRYQVYHDEMSVIPENPQRELYDKYDFIETTSIFLALDGSKPVGTMRITRYSEKHKIPIFKNFEKELKNMFNIHARIREDRKLAEASRFTVLEDYRLGRSCVPSILTCMMYDRCVEDGITDLVIVANPEQLKLYENAGFKAFGIKKEPLTGIESPAMHAEVKDGFGQFIKHLKPTLKRKGLIQLFGQSERIKQEVVNL